MNGIDKVCVCVCVCVYVIQISLNVTGTQYVEVFRVRIQSMVFIFWSFMLCITCKFYQNVHKDQFHKAKLCAARMLLLTLNYISLIRVIYKDSE